uniref:Uncharacterized protein n=1 Tax=Trichobilharzia regenti TaxID=157069 RepID=A0AA85KBL4_TRIRE|nr:unnamed protein product [Trichobilharzia regenti]
MKSFGICEEEPESSTAVNKEFENDEIDGKVNIHDNDHDSEDLSLVDHDEMVGMPTTAKLNKGSVQLEREVGINADAVAEGMHTCETVSVSDQHVAHLSSDANAKPELIVKDSSGGGLAGRQISESRSTTASDPPLTSSTGINQSSLVLSSTMKQTPINSTILCSDYDSIGAFEKTKDIGQFSEDKPSVHTKVNCEPVSKFSDKLNVNSRSDSELCDDNGAVKKSVVTTGKPLLNRVSQNRVTASECSSDSTSLQDITSQSEGMKSFGICEEEPKSSTAVNKEFENDEIDGKVNIHDNDHDSEDLSLVDHDEMVGMPTTAKLNKGSVQLEREVGINADAVAEGMHTCETVSVSDQHVAHLSSDANAKPELIVKDSSGGGLAGRQISESRSTTASDPPLTSSTGINQSSLVLSSTMKQTPINSTILCSDYDSIGAFEKTKDIGQFSEDKPSVHTKVNCEPVSKFSDKLNVNSRSDSELCDDNGAVKKSVVTTGKPLLNRVSQNRVTASECSSDSTSLQDITSQSEGMKSFGICEEEPKSSTAVNKEFENDEIDGKVNIHDNDHDSADLSLVDHDEMVGMPTTAKLNKGSVQLEREVGINADAVAEGMHTCETVSVSDQHVAHLSSDANAKPELIVKDSSGGGLAGRQISESRSTTASDPPLTSSTGINQSSLVLSSTMKQTPINSTILCSDYDSIGAFEKTKDIGQFSEDKPSVHIKVNCEPVSKFSDKLNVNSRSDSELCDDNGAVKKSVVTTGKPLLNRVSQNRVTASECSSDSTSLQDITSQSEGMKSFGICEEEPKSSTAVNKEFENDEIDGKVNIHDNDHDSADLSLVDHDEMVGMPTTAKLNKGSVQLEREVGINADAVAEGMHTCETVSVSDQHVAHLSSDANAKPELIVKDSSGGGLAGRQISESRSTTASDPPLTSSTGINQSSLVLSSTMKQTPINSTILCSDYDSIGAFEKTKDIGQFSEDKPSVHIKVNCEPVSKFSDKLNVNSRSDSELCDDNGAVKKSVVTTGKPLLNRVSQNRVTASECSSDSTSLQDITSQSEGMKSFGICEEEPKSSTAVNKEFENDEIDGKVNIHDNDHDSADLSLVDHDEMNGMFATAELVKDSVQFEREAELRANAVVEGMDTHETVIVNDQRVAHLSSDVNAKRGLIRKDSSVVSLAVRQPYKSRTTTADEPLSSSTCVGQLSLVLSSTMK